MHAGEDKIVAAKNGSPLVLGVGKKEYFIASDVSPIIGYTKSVVYLDDGEILTVTKKGYRITDLHEAKKAKSLQKISWTIGQIERKGFRHFMLKEIFEQPDSVMNTMRGRLPNGKVKLGGLNLKEKDARKI